MGGNSGGRKAIVTTDHLSLELKYLRTTVQLRLLSVQEKDLQMLKEDGSKFSTLYSKAGGRRDGKH